MARSPRTSKSRRTSTARPWVGGNPPSELEIDSVVWALIRSQQWSQLARTVRAYGRRLGLPGNLILIGSMNRQLADIIRQHPERAADIELDLEAAENEIRARGGLLVPFRVCTLTETIENLRVAARKYLPVVH
jgi:hypothetical protein